MFGFQLWQICPVCTFSPCQGRGWWLWKLPCSPSTGTEVPAEGQLGLLLSAAGGPQRPDKLVKHLISEECSWFGGELQKDFQQQK